MPEHLEGLGNSSIYCELEASDDSSSDENIIPEHLDWHGPAQLWTGEKQVVFTDGAPSHNQDERFRRAGLGIFGSMVTPIMFYAIAWRPSDQSESRALCNGAPLEDLQLPD